MRRIITILVAVLLTLNISAQTHQKAYIDRFAPIAVEEMYRSGVPASITLAQGILESGSGRSTLAVKSNNHFGIKCHNGWQGKKVYHDDDAKNECFRKYDNPEDSYRDHSDFLRYRDRYKFLFEYKITDYKSWAHGLKKAGYATDPSYPKKLIGLIEEYALYEYDKKPAGFGKSKSDGRLVAGAKTDKSQTGSKSKQQKAHPEVIIPPPPSQIEAVQPLKGRKRESFQFALSREMYSQNGVPFIYSLEGETYKSIASANGLFYKEILKFNDLKKETQLLPGTVVYLQKKKKSAAKGLEMHVVETGETLRMIAQRYAVRVDALCKLNGLEKDGFIKEGDIIKLRK